MSLSSLNNNKKKDGYEPIPDVEAKDDKDEVKDVKKDPEYPTEYSNDQIDLLTTLDTAISSGTSFNVDTLVPSFSTDDLISQGQSYLQSLVIPTITAVTSAGVALVLGLLTKVTAAEGTVNAILSTLMVYYPYINATIVGISAIVPMKERIVTSIDTVYKTIDDGQQLMDDKVGNIKTTTDTTIDSIQVKLGKVMEPIEPTLAKVSVHEKTIQQMVGDDSLNVIPDKKDIDREIDEAQGLIGDKIITAQQSLPKLTNYIPSFIRSSELFYKNIILPIMISTVLVQVLFAYITKNAISGTSSGPTPNVQVHIDTEPFSSAVGNTNATITNYLRGSTTGTKQHQYHQRKRNLRFLSTNILMGDTVPLEYFSTSPRTTKTQFINFKNPIAGFNFTLPTSNDMNHFYTSLSDTVRNHTSDIITTGNNLLNETSDWTGKVWNQTSGYTGTISNVTSNLTHTILDKASNVTSVVENKTSTILTEASEIVQDSASTAIKQASQVVSDTTNTIKSGVTENVKTDTFDSVQINVSDTVDTIQGVLSDKAENIHNQLFNQSENVKNELLQKKQDAGDLVNNMIQDWKSQANATVGEYQDKISDLTSNLNSTVTDYENQLNDLTTGFNDTINGYRDALPDQVDAVKEQVKTMILSIVISYIISLLQLGLSFLLTSPKVKQWVIQKSISAATEEVSRSLRSTGVIETYEDIMIVRMGRIRTKILQMIQFYHKVQGILDKIQGIEALSGSVAAVTDKVDNVMGKANSFLGRFGK